MRKLWMLAGLAAAVLAWSSAANAQRARIVVGGPNFRPFPVAAPDLVTLGAANAAGEKTEALVGELSGVLQSGVDLARSLELIPPKTYLAPDEESWSAPEYANWTNVGASGLVRGAVEPAGDAVRVRLRFYDVVAQRELTTKTYTESRDDAAVAVRKFLDHVVQLLTGERGIFSSRIAYVKRTRGGKAIISCDVDGRNRVRLTQPDALSLLPSWGPKGKHLLFTSYMKDNPDLFRIRREDGNLEWLSHKRGLNTGAAVSPDGTRIALTLSVDGNTEIYVMDWDGKNLERLTDSWGQDVSPSWSPDGDKLAFVSSRSGNPHIYVMNADGSAPKRLTFRGKYNQEPDWSPRADGQIAFTARDEFNKFDIFLLHPETGDITRLTQDEGNNESPSHSPDGHHIVFTSTRPPKPGRKLYIMDVDGKNQRRIVGGGAHIETPAWGPRLGYE